MKVQPITACIGGTRKVEEFIRKALTQSSADVELLANLVADAKFGGIISLDADPLFTGLLLDPAEAYNGGNDIFVFCKVSDSLRGETLARIYLHTNPKYATPVIQYISDDEGALIPEMCSESSIFCLSSFMKGIALTRGRPGSSAPLSIDLHHHTTAATTKEHFRCIADALNGSSPLAYWAHMKLSAAFAMQGYSVSGDSIDPIIPVTLVDIITKDKVVRVMAITTKRPPFATADFVCVPHVSDIHLFNTGSRAPVILASSAKRALRLHAKLGMPASVLASTWVCEAGGRRATATVEVLDDTERRAKMGIKL